MKVVFPDKSYVEAISRSKLLMLEERHKRKCDKLASLQRNYGSPNLKLHPLLPELNTDATNSLRTLRTFKYPKYKTDRF